MAQPKAGTSGPQMFSLLQIEKLQILQNNIVGFLEAYGSLTIALISAILLTV